MYYITNIQNAQKGVNMQELATYIADMGSICINAVWFNNGVGDGEFHVYYSETLPDGFVKIPDVWFDLRVDNPLKFTTPRNLAPGHHAITISQYDTDMGWLNTFSREFLKADALYLARNDKGDFCFVKMF